MDYLGTIFGVSGKTALVTGGATGIGRMIAEALVHGGARVFIASRKGEVCEAVAAELNALDASGSAEGFAGDVGSEGAINALVAKVQARTDRLDILVNNAGITWGQPFGDFSHAAWEKVFNVNVAGMFTLTRNLTPLLVASATTDDPARIINIGSVMGIIPLAEGAYSYAVSKGAVHHLTKILAAELAAKNITVNAFAPGPFPSKMTAFAIGSDEGQAKVGANVPLGRVGSPEDIAGATLFICGRGGAYTSGAIIPLDGGMSVETSQNLFANALT
ncbi:MAG: SDR family NAD(P)-dependent oxidoreductase [Alphaproteobacteria bacterium]